MTDRRTKYRLIVPLIVPLIAPGTVTRLDTALLVLRHLLSVGRLRWMARARISSGSLALIEHAKNRPMVESRPSPPGPKTGAGLPE